MKTLQNFKRAAFSTLVFGLLSHVAHAQVGIGTETPQAKLHLHDGSLFGTTPEQAAANDPYYDPDIATPMQYGLRWFHDKSALRSIGERVGTGSLDAQSVGQFSFSSGYETFATGVASTAFGLRSSANGTGSFVGGQNSTATSSNDFAFGSNATASGGISVALGENVSTNGQNLSFILGSGINQSVKNDKSHQMVMSFSGGYKLFSNSGASLGVQLQPNQNAWTVISDVHKKENFAPVNGEDFLQKISKMKLTSWNYKGQDPKEYRHYGPMAQDFYAAFGKDSHGTIGNDTTINQADFDGVNLIAIQALVKRTEQLEQQNRNLQNELIKLRTQIAGTGPRVNTKDKREAVLRR